MLKKLLFIFIILLPITSCRMSNNDNQIQPSSDFPDDIIGAPTDKNDLDPPVTVEPTALITDELSSTEPAFFFDIETALYGLHDLHENIIVKPKWIEVSTFHEGLAWVKEPSPKEDENRIGYINFSGNYAVEPQNYKYAWEFSEGIAAVSLGEYNFPGRCVYIDKKGNVVLGEEYNIVIAGQFMNGYAICHILNNNESWEANIIDRYGSTMLDESYDGITYYEKDNLYIACNDNGIRRDIDKTVFITDTFEISAEFEGVSTEKAYDADKSKFFNDKGVGIIIVENNDQIVVDKQYKIIASGGEAFLDKNYIRLLRRTVDKESHELIEQKMALFSYKGEMLSNFEYDYIDTSDGDFYSFQINDRWGYLDNQLNVVVEPIYEYASVLGDGPYMVKKDGKYGYVDKSFTEKIHPEYDYAGEFVNGIAPVIGNDKFFFINKSGQKTEAGPEKKLEYLKNTNDNIKELPYLFYDNIEDKIKEYLTPLYTKVELPAFQSYDEIPEGAFIADSIMHMILPQTNTRSAFNYKQTDVLASAALIFGKGLAKHIKPADDFLFTYNREAQEFGTMETATYDFTNLVILDISAQDNIYEVLASTALVADSDVLYLHLANSTDAFEVTGDEVDIAKKVIYYDMQDDNAPNEYLYSSKYQSYYAQNYDLLLRRGEDYIKANPELFKRYKITLELNGGLFSMKSIELIT